MKKLYQHLILGLILSVLCASANGALNKQTTLIGKILISSVKGDVTCISDGRILEVKKGDTLPARGVIVRTAAGAHVTIVFSNGTGVYTDEKSNFEIVKFDQEFFAPNNNLKIEPSNSSTIVKLNTGRVVICTPRLVSGTTMVYQTTHAAVGIKGEKVMVEVTEQQTHVAVIEGLANVNVRDEEGNFVSIGQRLITGKEAFVKRAFAGSQDDKVVEVEQTAANPEKDAAAAAKVAGANKAAPVFKKAPEPAATKDGVAVVLKLMGSATAKIPGANQDVSLEIGSKLSRGAIITTDEGSELFLEPFEGAIANVRPKSVVQIETLSITTQDGVVKKQSALLALKAGTIFSTIDPAKRAINDYGVRTPKGIASAKGTSFSISIDGDGFSVAATADTVSFLVPDGTVYEITAGNVSVTPVGGQPGAPISLTSAIAANPALGLIMQSAFTSVVNVVQNNIGGFSAESATNLLTKVTNAVATAMPDRAPAMAALAVAAVSAPTSATAQTIPAAVAAIMHSLVSAAPTEAAQIASSAATASPAQAVTIAAAAAKDVPALSPQIASAVTLVFVQTDNDGAVTASSIQTAGALAAAITTAVPTQAPPVSAAIIQALAQAAPKSTATANSGIAAIVASSATTAAPAQAAPVASAAMKALTQTASFANASTQLTAQSAATLASAVTAVVPDQAQKVATAVMQLVMETNPNATPGAVSEIAGLLAASVSQAAPDQAAGIIEGVAAASNQTTAAVQASAAQFASQATLISQQLVGMNQIAAAAVQQGAEASQSLVSGALLAQDSAPVGGSGPVVVDANNSTSITITQFDPTEINQLTADLGSAQAAQSEVQFNTTTDGAGNTVVVPVYTSPAALPDHVISASAIGAGG